MASRAQLVIEFLVDNAKADRDVDETASRFDKLQGRMSRLVAPAAAVTGALIGFGAVAVNAASDTEQAMGAVESVFGSAAGAVQGYAADAATAVGLSSAEYMNLAAVAGAAFQNMGLSAEDAASQTDQLIGIGADLAATFGGSTVDAVEALQAAFRGEADPAEKFGLNLKQSAVNAKLAELGLDGLTGAAGEAARQQAIMALIMEGTADVQGQFAREADTAAGSQAIANAEFKNATSELGTALLPAVTAVTQAFAGMARWVSENSTIVLILAGVIGTLAVAVLAINAAYSVYTAVQALATASTWSFNAAWLASPITWIVVGIAAIVAGIILLWNNCEGFRNAVIGIWNAIKNAAATAWNAIKRAISAVITWAKGAVSSAGNTIRNVWNAIKTSATSVWNGIKAVVNAVVSGIRAYLTGLRTAATAVWNAIKSVAATVWNGIKAVVNGVVSGIKSTINTIKATFTSVFNTVKNVATSALNAILAPVRALQNAFNAVVNAVKSVIDWIGRIKIPEINLPFGLGSRSAPALAQASPMAAFAAAAPVTGRTSLVDALAGLRGPGLSGGSLTIINVSGTLNDTDSARAVRRVLRRDSRRRRGLVIGTAA